MKVRTINFMLLLSILFKFSSVTSAGGLLPKARFENSSVNYCSMLLSRGKVFGQDINYWVEKSKAKTAELILLYKRKGIEFDVVLNGPFESIVFRTTGIHRVNQIAKEFETSKARLKLATTPIIFLLVPDAGAAYESPEGLIPSISKKIQDINDLDLIAKIVSHGHTMLIEPSLVETIDTNAPIIQHELDHALVSSRRNSTGSDILGARGFYSKAYDGPTYYGFNSMEEAWVILREVARAAQLVKSNSFPGILSVDEVQKLTSMHIPKNDKEVVALLVSSLVMLSNHVGPAATVAAEAFFREDAPTEYFDHRGQTWARMILKVARTDNRLVDLDQIMPLPNSISVHDPNNYSRLEIEMRNMGMNGLAVAHLGYFASQMLRKMEKGQGIDLYPKLIKFLKSITGFESLMKRNGEPITAAEYPLFIQAL